MKLLIVKYLSKLIRVSVMFLATQTFAQSSNQLEINKILAEKGLSIITKIAATQNFNNINEVETLLGHEFKIQLDTKTYAFYETAQLENTWFRAATIRIDKFPNDTYKIRYLEIFSNKICITEKNISEEWFSSMNIPKEKNRENRDASTGWRRTDPVHFIGAYRWGYTISENKGVSYWLESRHQPNSCAVNFSFSFNINSEK